MNNAKQNKLNKTFNYWSMDDRTALVKCCEEILNIDPNDLDALDYLQEAYKTTGCIKKQKEIQTKIDSLDNNLFTDNI